MEMTGKDARWRRVCVAMAVTIGISLVLRVFMQAYPPLEPICQYVLSLPYAAFMGLVLYETPIRKQRGFQLMLLCLFWAVFTSLFHTYEYYDLALLPPYLYMMLFAFGVCYPLAFIQPPDKAERAYAGIAAAFCAAVTVLAGVGVYAAIAKVQLPSLAGGDYTPVGVSGNRLSIFSYPTVSAVFCGLALLLLVFLFVYRKNALSRALCVLAGLIVYVAMALTDGRTSSIFTCVCLGGVAYLIAETRVKIAKKSLRILTALCAAALTLLLSYAGMRLSVRAVNALSDAVAPQSASVTVTALAPPPAFTAEAGAPAEEPPAPKEADEAGEAGDSPDATKTRSIFENLSTLQGRTYAWQGAINALSASPKLLLLGASPVKVMEAVEPYIPENPESYSYPHLHSIVFQTLVSFGLPGLLLFAALMLYIVFHSVRVFFLGGGVCTLFARMLPLLIVFCLCVDMLEIFLTFNDVTKMSNPLFFLTAGYVVRLSTERIPKRVKSKA